MSILLLTTRTICDIDARILLWVHQLLSDDWTPVMNLVTDFGSVIALGAICLVAIVILVRRGQRGQAWIVVASFLASTGIAVVLKCIVGRARPQLWKYTPELGSSFPSGHMLRAVVIYGILACMIGSRRPRLRLVVGPACLLLVTLIGFSRMYLGVHWPSDVLASGLLGTVILIALICWYRQHLNS